MGISRVSFAPVELLHDMLGTNIGAATVLSINGENRVKIVFDSEIASREWYGCSDGTTTGCLKLRTMDVARI